MSSPCSSRSASTRKARALVLATASSLVTPYVRTPGISATSPIHRATAPSPVRRVGRLLDGRPVAPMGAPHCKNHDSLLCFLDLVVQVVLGGRKKNSANTRKVRVFAESACVRVCREKFEHPSKLVPKELRSFGPVCPLPTGLIANLSSRSSGWLDRQTQLGSSSSARRASAFTNSPRLA